MSVSRMALLPVLAAALALGGPPEPAAWGGTSPLATDRAEVVGLVTDARTGAPLPDAQVTVVGTGIGALTGADGRYRLGVDDAWAGREVTLTVQRIGYAPERRTITVVTGTRTLDFALQAQPMAMDELVVTGQAVSAQRRAVEESVSRLHAGPAAPGAPHTFPGRYNPNFNTEAYALIEENEFRTARGAPLSTFSIDVDRASYSNVRRFVRQGIRPPVDAVRIEELVNYFPYDDPAPDGKHPLSITTEVAPAPWQPLHQLLRIGLKGRAIDMESAPANNLVFLLDVSGSMNTPQKLPLLKTAFRMLVEELRPQDRVAIVVYAGAAGLVLPSTTGSEKGAILEAIESLEAGGSTAGGAGIRLAYAVAREHFIEGGNNRVILATDGDFNVGASSDAEMIRLIEEKRRDGTFLTVLGFGTGNLKDSKMEQLADHGNGSYAYIDSVLEAKKVLVSEMGGTLVTVAQDVKIQVEFNPARIAAYRLIGYENRLLAAEDFEDDTKDAGEVGAGHSVTALYELIPVGVDSPTEVRGLDDLRYQDVPDTDAGNASDELLFVKLRYQEPGGSESRLLTHPVSRVEERPSRDFRFASAVAAWGMLLRDSEHCAGFTLGDVLALAEGAVGDDPEGYRAEFVELVGRTRALELLEGR